MGTRGSGVQLHPPARLDARTEVPSGAAQGRVPPRTEQCHQPQPGLEQHNADLCVQQSAAVHALLSSSAAALGLVSNSCPACEAQV